MDFRQKENNPNPRDTASCISRLFFLWIVPLFRKGLNKSLNIDDIYNVPNEDMANQLGTRLKEKWDEECMKAKKKGKLPKFYKVILKIFGKFYILLGLAMLFDECVIRVAQPIFLRLLIRSFSNESVSKSQQFSYAFSVCFLSFLHAILVHPLAFAVLHIGMKCRVSTCSLIYNKTLNLSRRAQEETPIGFLVTMMSSDVNRFDMNLLFIPYLIIGPLQTAIFVFFLWEELGVSCLAGIGFVALLMPVQYYLGVLTRSLRFRIAQKSDERGRLMNEIIGAIRVIKFYAWEKSFISVTNQVRREEVKVLRKRAYLKSFYLSLFLSSKKFVPYLTFLTHVALLGQSLTADKVFFAVPIFDIIIANMVSTLPSAAAGVGELIVAMKRIESFLLLEDKTSDKHLEVLDKSEQPFVRMNSVVASWTGEKENLSNVSVDLSGDKLVVIVGPVASGKSSFLQALLGELRISSGKCSIGGRISYSAQDSWIFQGTLKQNIIFASKPFDEALYEDVLSACSLDRDFRQFPLRDETFVGEMSLSGGQKARVNLARCLYRKADIYLLDDILSAVDSKVGRHIFDSIKRNFEGSLKILAINQMEYLPKANHIIVMNKGSIVAQGTYDELVEQKIDFLRLMTGDNEPDYYRKASLTKLEAIEQELKKEEEDKDSHEEKMAAGSVSMKTYWEYFSSGGSIFAMLLVLTGFVVSQLLDTSSDYLLSHWVNGKEDLLNFTKNNNSFNFNNASMLPAKESEMIQILPTKGKDDDNFYISIYSCLVILLAFATTINSSYFFAYAMRISINIHNKMLESVVRAKMKFFDNNTTGRVLNRFSKDLCSLDESLPSVCFDAVTIFLVVLGVIVVVILSNFYVSIPSAFLVVSLWLIRKFYIQTARDVKRIEAVSRSPLFTQLTSSMQGLISIRALNAQKTLIEQFDGHQDIHSAAWFLFISSNRWFGIWLEMISVTFLTIVTFSFIFTSTTKGGFVGLAISSVLSLTFKFQWGMRQSAELENLMTSVERCLEYVNIESEPPFDSHPKMRPPNNWPTKDGAITFRNVSLSYDGKQVLKNISFEIRPREKFAIVGRTGAGKSSIISALFRMGDLQGDIFIDGVRINDIGLHDLRSKIAIIPQDPVLFAGSVRYNLDPFGTCKDEELWKVLEEVNIKESIPTLESIPIYFSVGQRQLVCLARAILRNNNVIVLDEATSNIDTRTDDIIQKTLRKKFANVTIITIAHRLVTVIDNDRILIMDNGQVKECNHPHILLEDKTSLLYGMAQSTGKSSLALLKRVAANAFTNKQMDL